MGLAIVADRLKTARMRTVAILSVVFFALAIASFAQEADEDLIVPEMELVEVDNTTVADDTTPTYTTHTQTVMQNETEVTYKPQGKVVQEPVEQVHMVPVTKTVPVKKQVKVETIVKEPAPVATGCDLVVESCFATPATEAVPAWKAPVLSYEKSYTTLCADEAASKKAAENKHKGMEKKTKEAAAKGVSAEKAPRSLRRPSRRPRLSALRRARRARGPPRRCPRRVPSVRRSFSPPRRTPRSLPPRPSALPTPARRSCMCLLLPRRSKSRSRSLPLPLWRLPLPLLQSSSLRRSSFAMHATASA